MAEFPWDDIGADLEGIGSEAEREARRERAGAEAEARELHLLSRGLVDVVREAMQAGDRVRLGWPGGETVGVPTAAVGDLVVFEASDAVRAVNLGAVATVEVVERHAAAGVVGDRTVGSFVAFTRLVAGREVTVSVVGGRSVTGTLVVTGSDHLLVRTRGGDDVAVARTGVAAVSLPGPLLPF